MSTATLDRPTRTHQWPTPVGVALDLPRPAGAPQFGPFDACATCARVPDGDHGCICDDDQRDIRRYSGRTGALRVFTPAMQARLNRLPRSARTPVTIRVETTAQHWRITAEHTDGLFPARYTVTLAVCVCPREPCHNARCGDGPRGDNRAMHCHNSRPGAFSRAFHRPQIAAFVDQLAETYPGAVTVAPIPNHPHDALDRNA